MKYIHELDEARKWAEALILSIDAAKPQIAAAMDGSAKLPQGCPSRAALAELILRDVKGKLREVAGAVERTEAEIYQTDRRARSAGA